MKLRTATLVLLALLLATLAGCASRGEIETMQRQLDYLERSSAQTEERIALLDSLYREALERNISYQADLQLVLNDLLDRSNIIDGRLTDIETRVATILNRMGGGTAVALPRTQTTDSTGDTTTSEQAPTVDAEKMFDNAFEDMRTGNYDLAIMQFEEYLTLFGNTALADDAQYWLAECYYGKKEFARAIPEFEKVEQQFPQSNQLVPALYKLARSYQETGNATKARALFNRIINDYPDSFEAGPAKERLEEL
ncbi:MAG: tol-pal system protein YbgF [bacterium]